MRFANAEARYRNRAALTAVLARLFLTRTAEAWESLLTAADVACVRADGMGHRRFLYEDPHPNAIGFMVPTRHWKYESRAPDGKYWRHGPVLHFSETPCDDGKPFTERGEHSWQILRELGYDASEIERLHTDHVVDWTTQPSSLKV